ATAPVSNQRQWRIEFRPSAELAAKGITVNTVRERLASLGQVISASPRVLEEGGVAFEFTVNSDAPDSAFEPLLVTGITYSQIGGYSDIALQPAGTSAPTAGIGAGNVVRVDMKRLDDLMRIVGELVISRFHLNEALSGDLTCASLRTLQDINS